MDFLKRSMIRSCQALSYLAKLNLLSSYFKKLLKQFPFFFPCSTSYFYQFFNDRIVKNLKNVITPKQKALNINHIRQITVQG